MPVGGLGQRVGRRPPALEYELAHHLLGDVFNIDTVRLLILGTGYPESHIHFVKGRVEDTLPEASPHSIALLRLDTDWYESTWHELVHLYPRVSNGGVLIIDDYGHWDGSRAAVDRYLRWVQVPCSLR